MHTDSMKNSTGRNFTPSRRGIYTLVGRTGPDRQTTADRRQGGNGLGTAYKAPGGGTELTQCKIYGLIMRTLFCAGTAARFHKAKDENHWSCFTKSSRGS